MSKRLKEEIVSYKAWFKAIRMGDLSVDDIWGRLTSAIEDSKRYGWIVECLLNALRAGYHTRQLKGSTNLDHITKRDGKIWQVLSALSKYVFSAD